MKQLEPTALAADLSVTNDGQPTPAMHDSIAKEMFLSAMCLGSANAVYLAINAVLTILLPRYLPVVDYGIYRLFVLYGGFVGLLHFGFLDGLLTRWAADPEALIPQEMRSAIFFLMIQLAAGLLVLGIIADHIRLFLPDWFWVALAVFAVILNVATLVQYALQAGRSFKVLSSFLIVQPAVLLICIIVLKILELITIQRVVWAYVLSTFAAAGVLWILLPIRVSPGRADFGKVFSTARTNLSYGWGILLGNLCMNLTLALDRVFVSAKFSIEEFAFYSFAVSVLAILYSIMTSLTRVVLPYLSQSFAESDRLRVYRAGRDTILLAWIFGLSAYFLLHPLAQILVPKYLQSLPFVRVLLLGTGFAASIQILHSNFFRIANRQNLFFGACLFGLVITSLGLLRASQAQELQDVAIAMVLGLMLWWLVGECLLRKVIGLTVVDIGKSVALSAGMSSILLVATSISDARLGFAIYFFVACLASALFLRKPILYAKRSVNSWLLGRVNAQRA